VQGVLERWRDRLGPEAAAKLQIIKVTGVATRALLQGLVAEPVDALVLVDHVPFAGGSPPAGLTPDLPPGEIVRDQAQRAILALELAHHAVRTVPLAGAPGSWPATLAALLGLPGGLPKDVPGNLPARPQAKQGVDVPLTAKYLAPLFAAPMQPGPLALAWSRQCFLDGDAPGSSLPATVEVAGRARIVAYGPYLPLPAGGWKVTACLGFSPDIGKMPFILEIDTGAAVTRGFFEVERGGFYTLDLDVRVVDSFHPIELRLISQESSLEGQVSLIEVTLRQSADGG
jgi:hypothetical protein